MWLQTSEYFYTKIIDQFVYPVVVTYDLAGEVGKHLPNRGCYRVCIQLGRLLVSVVWYVEVSAFQKALRYIAYDNVN